MNNTDIRGYGGDFAEKQSGVDTSEPFEKVFESGRDEILQDREAQNSPERELGGIVSSETMREILGEAGYEGKEKFEVPDVPEMKPAAELKPLIADGTTEKKLGHIGVSLVGEKVDAEGIGVEVKKIKELPLYEQSAARDEASARMIYANFGRMIGNDDIGEIQAEEKSREAAESAGYSDNTIEQKKV